MSSYPRPFLVVCLVTLALGAGCRTVTVSQKSFFPRGALGPPAAPVAGAEDVRFTMGDGAQLRGYWIPVAGARGTLLFFNPQGNLAEEGRQTLVQWARRVRVNVLTYDLRGVGRSDGTGTIDAVKADFVEVLAQLGAAHELGKLVAFGSSLGAMVAVTLAAEHPDTFAAVVLDSAAADVPSWAQGMVPAYARPLVKLKVEGALLALDPLTAVHRFTAPLLLTVGSADVVTPPRFSEQLLAASTSAPKALHVFQWAGHVETLDQPDYVDVLDRFLSPVLGP